MPVAEPSRTDTFVPPPDARVIQGKGEFVAAGVTSLVERLPNGDIIKTPWDDAERGDCVQDIITEAKIYQMLGEHPRLVKFIDWDPVQHSIVLEFMPHGTLQQYVEHHFGDISRQEQFRWVRQAAEGLHLLHESGILHCDVGPHNFLLDSALDLKIADFGGSSVNGSSASICPGIRYRVPSVEWRPGQAPTLSEDLFALGSVVFFIFTGNSPFYELEEEEVEKNYKAGVFPDTSGIPCADIIHLCWQQRAKSALEMCEAVDRLIEIGPIGDST
ncbi:hypothetical protein DCS_07190 [Drechmeria coniospora]|uniref:Protein kinase domain-containing protein n=1 Tax=Drechmeria coniospora TaxID=98403 RepID=A0A151GDP2_DRECN|nr:hypothetical protein DCS_07190 [Drechmeria coniospora]KYK55228.1 hypothetical protein DCS_07190 [Drechmeria coniospora]ODA82151.1 hypothetical protein RJ55_00657 [Drechmeria coniospora]